MDSTKPKPFVFVLMPFSKEFDDIYQLGIKQSAVNAGAYAERVDEQIFTDNILQRIYNQIDKADIIVADMTGRSANVFYEVGYAHALGKDVILLTQDSDDIPFDLKHYPHIIYENSIGEKLIPQLTEKLKWAIHDRKSENKRININNLDLYIYGEKIQNNSTVNAYGKDVLKPLTSKKGYLVDFDINNNIDSVLIEQNFKVCFLTDDFTEIDFYRSEVERSIKFLDATSSREQRLSTHIFETQKIFINEEDELYLIPIKYSLSPGDWQKLSVVFYPYDTDPLIDKFSTNVILRLFTDKGKIDLSFKLIISDSLF